MVMVHDKDIAEIYALAALTRTSLCKVRAHPLHNHMIEHDRICELIDRCDKVIEAVIAAKRGYPAPNADPAGGGI